MRTVGNGRGPLFSVLFKTAHVISLCRADMRRASAGVGVHMCVGVVVRAVGVLSDGLHALSEV